MSPNKSPKQRAFELGRIAYSLRIVRVPGAHSGFNLFVNSREVDGLTRATLMREWIRGWDKANLDAPMPEVDIEEQAERDCS